jgi:hypothetical protein
MPNTWLLFLLFFYTCISQSLAIFGLVRKETAHPVSSKDDSTLSSGIITTHLEQQQIREHVYFKALTSLDTALDKNTVNDLITSNHYLLQLTLESENPNIYRHVPDVLMDLMRNDQSLAVINRILSSPRLVNWKSVENQENVIFSPKSFASFCKTVFEEPLPLIQPSSQTPRSPYTYAASKNLGYYSGILFSKFIRKNILEIISLSDDHVVASILNNWFNWMVLKGYQKWIIAFLKSPRLTKYLEASAIHLAIYVAARNGYTSTLEFVFNSKALVARVTKDCFQDTFIQSLFAESPESLHYILSLRNHWTQLSDTSLSHIFQVAARVSAHLHVIMESTDFMLRLPLNAFSRALMDSIQSRQRCCSLRVLKMILNYGRLSALSSNVLSDAFDAALTRRPDPIYGPMTAAFFKYPDILLKILPKLIDQALHYSAFDGNWELNDLVLWNPIAMGRYRDDTLGFTLNRLARTNQSQRLKLVIEHNSLMPRISSRFRGYAFVSACEENHVSVIKLFLEYPWFLYSIPLESLSIGLSNLGYSGHEEYLSRLLNDPILRQKLTDSHLSSILRSTHSQRVIKLLKSHFESPLKYRVSFIL